MQLPAKRTQPSGNGPGSRHARLTSCPGLRTQVVTSVRDVSGNIHACAGEVRVRVTRVCTCARRVCDMCDDTCVVFVCARCGVHTTRTLIRL